MGADIEVIGGNTKEDEARLTITCMNDGDVLVIEEIHRMGKRGSEWLLNLLQDGVFMGPFGAEVMPEITVVGTTTEVGKMLPAVVSRFMLPPLDPYTAAEATEIAALRSRYHLVDNGLEMPSWANCEAIAAAASNNPRRIDRMIKLLRNAVVTGKLVHGPDGYDMQELFRSAGMTPDGLDRMAQQYLLALFTTFGGLVGESTIAKHLRAPGGVAETEYHLQAKGYITMTSRGRRLSKEGTLRAKALTEEVAA
jgi:Holliday junction resolvasome RuvABC ATP-dependent DNA helicase subunit